MAVTYPRNHRWGVVMFDRFRWSRTSWRRNELTKAYEPVQPIMLAWMASELGSFTFFDIGANVGAYSMVMASQANVQRVMAFEPQPDCLAELRRNIQLNRYEDIVIPHPIALSDERGEASFRKTGRLAGDSGLVSTFLGPSIGRGREIRVDVGRLDDIYTTGGGEVVIKIDVEGHESNVLRGAERVMTDNVGFLQIEIHEQSALRHETERLLRGYGWHRIVSVHWDHFYTNLPRYESEACRLALVQNALTHVVDQSLGPDRPWRKQLIAGFTLECRRDTIRAIRSALTLPRFRRAG